MEVFSHNLLKKIILKEDSELQTCKHSDIKTKRAHNLVGGGDLHAKASVQEQSLFTGAQVVVVV